MGEIDHMPHRSPRARTDGLGATPRRQRALKAILCGFAISVLVAGCRPAEAPKPDDTAPLPDETQQRIAERRKTVEDLGVQVASLQARFPAQADVDAVFDDVRALMEKHRLELSKAAASGKSENTRQHYGEVSRTAEVTGPFPSIQAFFRDVAALERPVALSDVTLARGDEQRAALRTSFAITAYYLSDANRQPPAPVASGSPEQELAALDEQARLVRERLDALAGLAKAQRGPAAVLDLIVAKLPASAELRLDAVRLQNEGLTVSGVTTSEELVTQFGRGLQSDTSGVLQDVSFRAERKGPAQPAEPAANANANRPAEGEAQELAFDLTAKYVPAKIS
jgi:hypothetical protein